MISLKPAEYFYVTLASVPLTLRRIITVTLHDILDLNLHDITKHDVSHDLTIEIKLRELCISIE
jgi:hypothetical protein